MSPAGWSAAGRATERLQRHLVSRARVALTAVARRALRRTPVAGFLWMASGPADFIQCSFVLSFSLLLLLIGTMLTLLLTMRHAVTN